MKTILFFVLLIIPYFKVIASEKVVPPHAWWGEPQTIKEIETENTEYIKSRTNKFKNVEVICIEPTTKEIESTKNYRVKRLPCGDQKKIAFNTTLGDMFDLSQDSRWTKLKSILNDGDEIRSYSAPPLSGGFGYIIVREGKIIHVLEQGQQ